jgi:predicted permease
MPSFRSSLRGLRLNLAAVSCIALGAAATAAVAALVDVTLLRPLPFPAAERLLRVWHEEAGADRRVGLSIPEVDELRALPAFDAVLAAARMRVVAQFDDGARRMRGEAVTPEYFDALGLSPRLGRLLGPDDFAADATPAVVLSHATWTTLYAADPGVVGRPLRTATGTFTVVGVAPSGFAGTVEDDVVEFFVPLPQYQPAAIRVERRVRVTWAALRLREGATRAAAEAQLAAWGESARQRHPDAYRRLRPWLEPMGENWRAGLRTGGTLLAASAGLLLLVAAANVAGLLAARALARRRDFAVRAALGASRARLIARAGTEVLVVVGFGGAIGVALAGPLLRAFLGLSPVALPAYVQVAPDLRVALIAAGALAVAALAAGLGPVLMAASVDPQDALRTGSRGTTAGRGERRFAAVLIAAEVGLTLALLVAGGLLVQSWQRLERAALGFDAERLLRLAITLSPLDLPATDALPAFRARVRAELAAEPGVRRVATVWPTLPPWDGYRPRVRHAGLDPVAAIDGVPIGVHAADAQLLPTLGIPVVAGRGFDAADEAGAAAVVSESLARRMGGVARALGQVVTVLPEEEGEPERAFTVVGVARDVAWDGLADDRRALVRGLGRDDPRAREDLFVSPATFRSRIVSVAVAVEGDPAQALEPLRRRLAKLAPGSAVHWNETMRDGLRGEFASSRFYALLLAAFSASALLLTAVGVFAMLSHFVGRRTAEIGVRVALGAAPWRVVALVASAGGRPLLAGLALGAVAAAVAARGARELLYGVGPADFSTFAAGALVLVAAAAAASLLPARRAIAIAPSEALRAE